MRFFVSVVITSLALTAMGFVTTLQAQTPAVAKVKALIIDGANNHDWEVTTDAEAWQQWNPDFSAYDTVLLNYNGAVIGMKRPSRLSSIT